MALTTMLKGFVPRYCSLPEITIFYPSTTTSQTAEWLSRQQIYAARDISKCPMMMGLLVFVIFFELQPSNDHHRAIS